MICLYAHARCLPSMFPPKAARPKLSIQINHKNVNMFHYRNKLHQLQSCPWHRARQRAGNLVDSLYLDVDRPRPFTLLAQIPCTSGSRKPARMRFAHFPGTSGVRSLIVLPPVRVVGIPPSLGRVAEITLLRAAMAKRRWMGASVTATSRACCEFGRMPMLLVTFRRSRRRKGAWHLREIWSLSIIFWWSVVGPRRQSCRWSWSRRASRYDASSLGWTWDEPSIWSRGSIDRFLGRWRCPDRQRRCQYVEAGAGGLHCCQRSSFRVSP